jgi:hypothetical protein
MATPEPDQEHPSDAEPAPLTEAGGVAPAAPLEGPRGPSLRQFRELLDMIKTERHRLV